MCNNNSMGISLELEESIFEMSTVHIDKTDNLLIAVFPNINRKGSEPYFKILDSYSYQKAKKMARIAFKEPRYIHRKDSDGKIDWKLDSKEKKMLVRHLNSESNMFGEKYNVWQQAIILFNLNLQFSMKDILINTINNHIYKEALPIDLPIPDYTKL